MKRLWNKKKECTTTTTTEEKPLRKLTAGQTVCIPTMLALEAYTFLSWYVTLIERVGVEESNYIDIELVKACRDEMEDALCGEQPSNADDEYRYKE